MKIAIDGPAGSGKSTIAKILSKVLKFEYLDTGALYRGVALLVNKNKLELDQEKEITALIDGSEFSFIENKLHINGECVEDEIRKNDISKLVSFVAAKPYIRKTITEIERKIAHTASNIILDGRDIGTVVLPDAEVKIFLNASSRVRAIRRHSELQAKGEHIALEQLEKEINHRDHLDMNRDEGPLAKAEDAVLIDTDDLGIQEVVNKILEIVNK